MIDFYNFDEVERLAVNLFHGWGYNFYRIENQLRADSLTVRAKAGWLLGLARSSVDAAESVWRRENLPPPTREKPRPDVVAVAGAETLERLSSAIGAIDGRVRALPAPENDRMSQRYRQEAATLEKLLRSDIDLVGRAEMLRALLDGKSGAWIIENSVQVKTGLESLEAALRERQAALFV